MNISKITCAVGAACAAMAATSAFALPASSYNPGGVVNSTDIRISGATAQDNGLLATLLQECVSGSLTRYTTGSSNAFLCTTGGTLSVGQPQVAVYKHLSGGSGNGVAPVNFAQTLPFLDFTKLATACTNTGVVTTFGTLTQPFTDIACTATAGLTTGAVTRLGLSDLEPAFFATAANTSALATKDPISTLIFGVPVSRNIYLALQAQQLLNTGACTNTASSTAAPIWEYSEQCMPTLRRAQVVSAYTQTGNSWGGIGVTSGLADDTIYVARRVDSSGTQKTFEALIARTPNGVASFKSCVVGTESFVQPDSGTTGLGAGDGATACSSAGSPAVVFGGSGGGNVRTCMIDHNTNGRGAIGILTAEDIAKSTDNWRFVKVDGYAPTHANVAKGSYQFWTVPHLNYTAATGALAGYTGVNGFIARLKFQLRDPVGLAIQQPFGASGLMANWDLQGNPLLALDFAGTSGVNPWGRKVGGAATDNCQMGKAANF